ncbi:hypothetical protein CPB85DRAFT_157863 [Mucidula mucida]|nr:hypothetical protein CPB85DRAFT_157863 [Mucidula mucida]
MVTACFTVPTRHNSERRLDAVMDEYPQRGGVLRETVKLTDQGQVLAGHVRALARQEKPRLVRVYYEAEGRLPGMELVTIGNLKDWVNQKLMELNTEDRFVVSTVERGILHVEWTEDPSEWLAKEVLELPSDLLVGNSPWSQSNVLDEDGGSLPRRTTQAHSPRRPLSIWRRSTRISLSALRRSILGSALVRDIKNAPCRDVMPMSF